VSGCFYQDAREVDTNTMTFTVFFGENVRQVWQNGSTTCEVKAWGLDDPLFPKTLTTIIRPGCLSMWLSREHWANATPVGVFPERRSRRAALHNPQPTTHAKQMGEQLCRLEQFRLGSKPGTRRRIDDAVRLRHRPDGRQRVMAGFGAARMREDSGRGSIASHLCGRLCSTLPAEMVR
jgi:hypothetical protein